MVTARGSVAARGSCHLIAGPPGLSISESDPESATVSRERRRVNMAAREVGKVVNDELVALRLQVTTLQQLVELVFEKVSMFVPIIPVPVAKPHQYMAAAPAGYNEDKHQTEQQQQQISVEPDHELSPQRFSGSSIPSHRPMVDAGGELPGEVDGSNNRCKRALTFDIFDETTSTSTQTDAQVNLTHYFAGNPDANLADEERKDDEVLTCSKWQPLVQTVVAVQRRRSQIPALCKKIADSIDCENAEKADSACLHFNIFEDNDAPGNQRNVDKDVVSIVSQHEQPVQQQSFSDEQMAQLAAIFKS